MNRLYKIIDFEIMSMTIINKSCLGVNGSILTKVPEIVITQDDINVLLNDNKTNNIIGKYVINTIRVNFTPKNTQNGGVVVYTFTSDTGSSFSDKFAFDSNGKVPYDICYDAHIYSIIKRKHPSIFVIDTIIGDTKHII
jgi:hypothetical protein